MRFSTGLHLYKYLKTKSFPLVVFQFFISTILNLISLDVKTSHSEPYVRVILLELTSVYKTISNRFEEPLLTILFIQTSHKKRKSIVYLFGHIIYRFVRSEIKPTISIFKSNMPTQVCQRF